MNERVASLREQSLAAEPRVSAERALLLTDFYSSAPMMSTPLLRAQAFRYIMERKRVYLGANELIVGERGPAPKATPTYPEICCHTLEDLDILHSRPKIPYLVDEDTRRAYERTIIPYWRGKSLREAIFDAMAPEWSDAYNAGIFTEFMEQRAPGHTVADDKIYRLGLRDFQKRIANKLAELDFFTDPEAYSKQQQLLAMSTCCDALIRFAERHAEEAEHQAAEEVDPGRKAELLHIASVCRHVPAHAPRDFHEALQMYWFVHLGVITELNGWDAFSPGRFDQHLYPFYRKGLEDGTLTEERARELLQCLWVKFNNQLAPPKVGVTAAESGTYTDFANISHGGLRPDGSDGVNELTYLMLDVVDEMRLVQPSTNIQLSKRNPDRFLHRALEIVRKGWGQPSLFNADAVVEELLRQGKSLEDARCGGTSGCVETGAFGKEAYILTGYFNLPKILELTLNNGMDPATGKQLGIRSGDPTTFATFEDLFGAYVAQIKHFLNIKIRGSNIIQHLYAQRMPAPFLSVIIDDCIERGKDYNAGGARYNTSYIQGVGIGTITDSLAAIRQHVYLDQTLSMSEILSALRANFENKEALRQRLLHKSPKYGNDDDLADEIMIRVFEAFHDSVNGRPDMRGGTYRIDMLPTTCHVYFGSVTGATPDGRRAGTPLSEGISPVQGADRKGPTAVLNSAAKMDHLRTGGTLLNMKFAPNVLQGQDGISRLGHLVRAYFRMDGHHIQFNVVTAETLRAAKREPERYRDLIVRVAGYSDFFCHLSEALQDEIIARTEHTAV